MKPYLRFGVFHKISKNGVYDFHIYLWQEDCMKDMYMSGVNCFSFWRQLEFPVGHV